MPYIGNTIRAADDYRLIDDISSSFNGSTTSFALQVAGSAPVPFPKSPQQVLISVNGVIQEPDPTGASGFNLVGTNIVFSSAPTNGHAFFGIIYATADYLNSGGNFPTGSLGAPSITFVGDEDTGIYRKGSGSVAFVSDSTEIANTDSNGITISSGNLIIPDKIIHNGDTNTTIRFPAADQVSIETGGTERFKIDGSGNTFFGESNFGANLGQIRIINNTTSAPAAISLFGYGNTSSGDVFAKIDFASQESGSGGQITAVIEAQAVGTSERAADIVFKTRPDTSGSSAVERFRVNSSGHILPGTDSAYNIGANANRFANGYFDTLYGDGSNLTGITQTTINNNADNKLITGSGTANTLEAEGNLTFDGTTLKNQVAAENGTIAQFELSGQTNNPALLIKADESDQQITFRAGSGTSTYPSIAFDMGTVGNTLVIDNVGNLATGGVASPASSDRGNIYIKAASTIGSNGTGLNIVSNAHFNSGWKHIATGAASYLQLNANGHLIYATEASASAGATATFDRVFKVGIDGGTILNGGIGFSANLAITDAMAKVQIMGAVHTAFTRANSYLHIGGNESHSSAGMLQTISFGHVKTTTTHAPAYIGLLTTDRSAQEKGQIEIATRDVTTDTAPTPSLIVRPSKSIVRRGPSYANYVVSMQTINGGGTARNVQVFEDEYGQWLVVAKITSTDEFKGSMASTAQLDVTNNQVTGDPQWSSLFGDTYPSEVRYISASDWEYWRETRIIDFIHGVPDGRQYKEFFTNGNSSSMGIVADNKHGWKVAGCYDGFGRWRNPNFENHKMADTNAGGDSNNNPIITSAFFTTAGQTMNWHNGNLDAKFIASHNDTTDGQDDNWTTGWGWDDNGLIRSDEFPNNGNNSAGTDLADYNLWVLIKLGSPTFGHNA